ncbi:MAG: hypothetical protein J6U49_06065 [Alistipes sp.]|nr:hypothetical protein [Alistipes sp.]
MAQKVYLNDIQQELMYIGAKDSIVVGGRDIGKGPMHAQWNLRNFQRMPGSITGFVSPNAKRALTNTLPSMLVHWEKWGFKRDVHWCIGHKPPKKFGWPEPIFKPENYENVLSFYNGSIGFIISQDRQGTSNSHSFDALDIDEAKFVDFEQLKDETFPANRGNRQHFGHKSYHHGMLITSDMPLTKKGSWFLDYQNKCDQETIDLIRGIVYEIWKVKERVRLLQSEGKPVPEYTKGYLTQLNRDLCKLRSVAVYYREAPTLYNLAVLGEAFISQLKRDLPPLTFQTSVMCKRVGISRDGFYNSLTERNYYSATNFGYLDSLEYQFDKIKEPSSLMDADVSSMHPICIAFDFNSNINWLVAGQVVDGRNMRVLKSFFVKYERKLVELVGDFCKYYRNHKRKEVVFYYDSTAIGSNYAVNDEDYHWVIVDTFHKHGWEVNDVYIGKPMHHMEKQLMINRMLQGKANRHLLINRENNEDLIISIQTAGVYNGGKDKRGEKLAETEEDKLESRTDGSDAFDTLAIGCERFLQQTVELGYVGACPR